MNKVLVTGGAGYIGSHTVVELMQNGFDPIIVDNLSNSSEESLHRIEKITDRKVSFYKIDVCDEKAMKGLFEKHPDIVAIIHFAASKAIGESVEKPLLYYRNNVGSLLVILECMQMYKISNIVFSSSCTVYGQPDSLPVTENTPFKPAQSPYGNTKQVCEEILRDTAASDGNVKVLSLRYFNPVGAHPSAELGELPNGLPNNLVPFLVQAASGLRNELKVFGVDYDTIDGSAVRDYIHVVDLARAHIKAVQRLIFQKQKSNFECFNLGIGKGLTVLQLINAFERVNNIKVNYSITGRRPGDVEKIYADPSLATEELGWKAELSVDDMVRSAWKWQLNLNNLKNL